MRYGAQVGDTLKWPITHSRSDSYRRSESKRWDTTDFFRDITERGSLASLYDFENRKALFLEVDSRMKFSLLTLVGSARPEAEGAALAFFLHEPADLSDPERRFRLSAADFALLNPNTRTCPVFRTRRDAELTKWIYRRVPVLVREGPPEENHWGFQGLLMFMMNTASHLFRTREQLEAAGWRLEGNTFAKGGERMLPLYEAKMCGFYDHRTADVVISETATVRQGQPSELTLTEHQDPDRLPIPRSWVAQAEVEDRLSGRWGHGWLLGWRDITSVTNERTVIASVVPRVGVGNNLPISILGVAGPEVSALVACISSFAFDFVSRFKVGGTHLNFFITHQLAVPPPSAYESVVSWSHATSLRDWLLPRVLELTYTAWDLESFGSDLGYDGPPFRWDEERRFLLRCELDAAFFHLYLGSPDEWKTKGSPELLTAFPTPRDAVAYILDTFPIVRRKDEKAHGEYRTKRVILEIYDALQRAAETADPYVTRLDPPPADPRAAHARDSRPGDRKT